MKLTYIIWTFSVAPSRYWKVGGITLCYSDSRISEIEDVRLLGGRQVIIELYFSKKHNVYKEFLTFN